VLCLWRKKIYFTKRSSKKETKETNALSNVLLLYVWMSCHRMN